MKFVNKAAPLALAFASLAMLSACGSSEPAPAPAPVAAPAPAPAPPPNPMADASNACEAAVATNFAKARGHAHDQLTFDEAARKANATRTKGVIAASGAATYTRSGKPVKVTYTCTYNSTTAKVTTARFR